MILSQAVPGTKALVMHWFSLGPKIPKLLSHFQMSHEICKVSNCLSKATRMFGVGGHPNISTSMYSHCQQIKCLAVADYHLQFVAWLLVYPLFTEYSPVSWNLS